MEAMGMWISMRIPFTPIHIGTSTGRRRCRRYRRPVRTGSPAELGALLAVIGVVVALIAVITLGLHFGAWVVWLVAAAIVGIPTWLFLR
jgi:hypothetical protein